MIAVLLQWGVAAYVFIILGKVLSFSFSRLKAEDYSLIDTFFIGMCFTGTLICIASIFMPSGIVLAAALLVASVIANIFLCVKGQFSFKGVRDKLLGLTKLQMLLIAVIFLCFLSYIVMPPQLDDTFYYHIQNIMWNDQYRVVPGLANLHERFGFNSNILLLYSTFGFKSIFGLYTYGINALCLMVMYMAVIAGMTKVKPLLTAIMLIILTVFLFIFRLAIGSASTDIAVNLLIIYLMYKVLMDTNAIKNQTLLFWILPTYCLTLKVSVAFICLLCLYITTYLIKQKSYKLLTAYMGLALLVVLPWLVRNVIISGYLVHPFPAVDIFTFDWKLPVEYSIKSKKYIEAYAISIEAFDLTDKVLQYPFWTKVERWFSEQYWFNVALVVSSGLAMLVSLPFFFIKKIYKTHTGVFVFFLTSVAGWLFWVSMAPDARFALGFVCAALFVPVFVFLPVLLPSMGKIINIKSIAVVSACIILLVGVFTIRYYRSVKDPRVSYSYLLVKPQTLSVLWEKNLVAINGQRTINNLTLYIPRGACVDCELPCSRDYVDNIEMRGATLQDGFRQKKD